MLILYILIKIDPFVALEIPLGLYNKPRLIKRDDKGNVTPLGQAQAIGKNATIGISFRLRLNLIRSNEKSSSLLLDHL